MYVIDYDTDNSTFTLEILLEGFCEPDEYSVFTDYLKSKFLRFNGTLKKWTVERNKIREIIEWFNHDKRDYVFKFDGEEEYNKLCFSSPSIKFFRNNPIEYSILNPSLTLYDYQKKGIEFSLSKDRAFVADDPGLGKSIQAITTFGSLFKKGDTDFIIIIVKNMLQYQWKHEILYAINLFTEDDIAIIDNTTKIKPFENYKDKKVLIIPNHLLADVFASYRKDYSTKLKLKKIRWNKPTINLNKILDKDNICLIVDESHEFKNMDALKTKALHCYKKFFKYIYLYTATPSINRFEDWYSQLKLLDDSLLNHSYNSFKLYIAKSIGNRFSMYNINSYDENKIESVKQLINPFVIKRLKSELPEVKTKQITRPIFLEMSQKELQLYQLFLQSEVYKLEQEYDIINLKLIFQKFPYLLMVLDCPFLLKSKVQNERIDKALNKFKFEDSVKVQYLKSFVEDLTEKTIIFSTHPETLNQLNILFNKCNPLIIHGQLNQSQEERAELVNQFNNKSCDNQLFLLSTQIGGVGLNLNKDCRREVFYDIPFDATLAKQAKERTDRINSTQDSIIDFLVYDKSLDLLRYNKVIKRLEFNDTFLNKNLSKADLRKILEGII